MGETSPNERHGLPQTEQRVRSGYDRIFKKLLPKLVELGQTTEEAGFVTPNAGVPDTAPKRKRGFGYIHNGFVVREQDMMLGGRSSGGNRSVISTVEIPNSEDGSEISMHLYDRANERKPDIGYILTIVRKTQLPDATGSRQETIVVDERNGSTYSAHTTLKNPDYNPNEPVSRDNMPLLETDITPEMGLDAPTLRSLVAPIYGEALGQVANLK